MRIEKFLFSYKRGEYREIKDRALFIIGTPQTKGITEDLYIAPSGPVIPQFMPQFMHQQYQPQIQRRPYKGKAPPREILDLPEDIPSDISPAPPLDQPGPSEAPETHPPVQGEGFPMPVSGGNLSDDLVTWASSFKPGLSLLFRDNQKYFYHLSY